MTRIAVLTSTKPLREKSQEGRTKVETVEAARLQKLAERYDLVIVGSRASEDLFRMIQAALPKKAAERFRTYARSFFNKFKKSPLTPTEEDFRNDAWMAILDENGIDYTKSGGTFDWQQIGRFILDKRVTVIDNPEDIDR